MKIHGRNILKIIAINLVVFLSLIVVADFFSYGFLAAMPRLSSLLHHGNQGASLEADARVNSPAYQDKKYARMIYRDLAAMKVLYDPNAVWSLAPQHGATLNIDEAGHRHTCYLSEVNNTKPAVQIFMFGGSTLFGTGSDDCNTIPSQLVKQLTRSTQSVQITNFGVTGHESTQELAHLIAELRKGARPDIVIFYDGVNDVYAGAYSPGIPGAHENLDSITNRFESSAWSQIWKNSSLMKLTSYIVDRTKRHSFAKTKTDSINETINTYKTNLEILDSLSHRYGFQYIAFWQPVMYVSHKSLTAYEKSNNETGLLSHIYQDAYGQRAKNSEFKQLSFYDISSVFDREQEDIYVDYCHVAPKGNQLVAEVMADKVLPLINKAIAAKLNKKQVG